MSSQNNSIALNALELMGGAKFLIITGSKAILMEDRLRLQLKKNRVKANMLDIIGQESAGRYEMRFFFYRMPDVKFDIKKGVCKNIEEKNVTKMQLPDVRAEQLRDFFEEVTGLYVTLRPRPINIPEITVIE